MSNYSYGQYPQSPYQQPYGAAEIPPVDRGPAALAHGASLIAAVLSAGWISFVGPLVMWVLYKDRSPYVREAAAGAFNFNVWANIMMVIGWLLLISVVFSWIGIPLMIIAGILMIWTHLRGVMRSLNGKPYVYKHQLRILN